MSVISLPMEIVDIPLHQLRSPIAYSGTHDTQTLMGFVEARLPAAS